MFRKLLSYLSRLHWGYQVAIATSLIVCIFLLYKFLAWFSPIFLLIFALIYVSTEGEVFSLFWKMIKQRLGYDNNDVVDYFYHWLTESGVSELPLSTIQYLQGVEAYSNEGIYFIHLNERISTDSLESFMIKARQQIGFLTHGSQDCVVSLVEKEPILAIKIRLLPSDDLFLQNSVKEEDF